MTAAADVADIPAVKTAPYQLPLIRSAKPGISAPVQPVISYSREPPDVLPEGPTCNRLKICDWIDVQDGRCSWQCQLRTTMVELSWLWVRYQPDSALARWFQERVQHNGGRHKKPAIVALARKLLIALWKYATAGVVIEGAIMKAA